MRAFDKYASETAGVKSLLLMENAGRGAAEVILEHFKDALERCVVLCGSGNNGGDGFVLARHLALHGVRVTTFLAADPDRLGGDAKVQLDAWVQSGGANVVVAKEGEVARVLDALFYADVAVDALLGTGLQRPVSGLMEALVCALNDVSVPTVSLDIPSGIDADTGQVLGAAVHADFTTTFAHPKPGLYAGAAVDFTGPVHGVHIGADPGFWSEVGASSFLLEGSDVALRLPPRSRSVHKRQVGKVLVVAGSPGKTGAALLAASGAHRAGAGLVTVACWPEVAVSLGARVLETMTVSLREDDLSGSLKPALLDADAVVVGPGLGLDARARELVEAVLRLWDGPLVMDADAISHFEGRADELQEAAADVLLTPHAGELSRLLGESADRIEADRFKAVRSASALTSAVVLLKGPHTLIAAPGEDTLVNTTGTQVLATGGSGDVLGGVIAALSASGVEPRWAAAMGAWLHGRAGELWQEEHADRGLLAGELGELIACAVREACAGHT